ncbi:ribosomal protein S18-alanine N-acetyltransferase [Halococcus saccharolyticus]|uniref:Ribosomal-protein-alanine acetyltransferase n=1 Tax=Halococcus saccharolyticus DSM 5350 TaxID=1227455 RepID=M0MD79_9EURY|nr:ribosomal protein S18-alanine N-acetyltransferase [Halococcus saccharolyticus]EMA43308.1 ribosomal-protein-alanine acetyltransferase [Halococcus saccharolyticus DSM 5350]
MTTTATDDRSVRTREAARADLLAVFRIEKASFPQPWPYRAFERFLGEPGFLVADSGEVVGYVLADTTPKSGRPIGHVKDIAVAPFARGQGIGATLLARAIDAMREQKAGSVRLEVRESNEPALGLYRRFGFTHRTTSPGYYADGEDALVLVRDLDG